MANVKKGMAAQFTVVTLEDFLQFFRRGYGPLRPTKGEWRGEVYFDLHLSPAVVVRVFTSVSSRGGEGAGLGQDAIRLTLCSTRGFPLVTRDGKWPIVKRTQNWRDNLRDLIGEHIEMYSDKESYWDDRASGGLRLFLV